MAEKYLRYLSVTALIVAPDRKRFLIGDRSGEDRFYPETTVFPSGRVEGKESIIERLYKEIDFETGVVVDRKSKIYLGECSFPRDGYQVNQLCFGVLAVPGFNISPRTSELTNLRLITPREFNDQFESAGYHGDMHRFVREAQRVELLE